MHTCTPEFSQVSMCFCIYMLMHTVHAKKVLKHICTYTVHILSNGMKLDMKLNNSSRQITRGSSRKGKKTEHMLVDSYTGCEEMLS